MVFKRLTQVVVVIAGLAAGYYFVFALPAHNLALLNFEKHKYLESKQSDCSKTGGRLSAQFNNVDSVYFAEQTNTCMLKFFNSSKQLEETPADNFH